MPEITPLTFFIICPLVFLAGFIDAIAGGGGLISLPAYLIAGIPAHQAIATNKLSSSLGTLIATIRFLKNKCVLLSLVVPTVLLALLGSFLGASLSLSIDEKYLQYLLIIVLPVAAFFILFKKDTLEAASAVNVTPKKRFVIASLAAFFVGAYDGFYGPGTGTFLVILLTAFAGMDVRTANGNTKCINLASNVAALVTFFLSGKVLISLGITAALFNMAGNYLGSGMVLKSGTRIVRPVILVVLVLLFLKILIN